MQEIKVPADADKYLRETWSGQHAGPVTTLSLLLTRNGFFEVPHLVLSYLDYLTAMSNGKARKSEMGDICDFVRRYFPSSYHDACGWLVFQFRHGLTHEYAPKVIDVGTDKLVGWKVSLGRDERKDHLRVVPTATPNRFTLHVNADQLVDDFVAAVELFRNKVVTHADTFASFKSGFDKFQVAKKLADIKASYIRHAERTWLVSQV